jgi:hypothetical protein
MGLATVALVFAALLQGEAKELDARAVEAAWKRLSPAKQEKAVRLLRERCEALETTQMKILRAVLATDPRSDDEVPRAKPPPFYDPEVHAENLPIERKELRENDPRLEAARKVFLAPRDARLLHSGFRYDWGAREVLRGEELDPSAVCINAWNGYPPGLDRAWTIALRALDGGHESRALAAFDHVYTDRAGLVYPGITLFDAWCSGVTMEMPDVDALGILHDVVDDWTTWVSPVPAKQHRALYARIQELFEPARRYRELLEALADVLLSGDPPPRGNLGRTTRNLHAIWASCENDPAALARDLPGAAGARDFVERWVDACHRDPSLYERAGARQRQLVADGAAVRALLLDVLRELEAFPDSDDEAPEDPAPPSDGGGEPDVDRVHQRG